MTMPVGSLEPELAALVSWVGYAAPRPVTEEAIRTFAGALDPAGAERSTSGREAAVTVAPPTFFCPDPVAEVMAMGFVRPQTTSRSIDGGSTWCPGVSARVGDVLTSIGRVAGVTPRTLGDGRRMVATRCEVQTWNQRGELAGVATGTILNYEDRVHA
jgi:hypothetical protein